MCQLVGHHVLAGIYFFAFTRRAKVDVEATVIAALEAIGRKSKVRFCQLQTC